MRDDHVQIRRRELVSNRERAPLCLLGAVNCKLVGQTDGGVYRQRGTTASESSSDGSPQDRDIQLRVPNQHPEVEEVLHATVGYAERHDCMEFFGNYRVTVDTHVAGAREDHSTAPDRLFPPAPA